jgi:hypothetical protein
MKIIKIERMELGGDKIVVTVEGYPHAQPVFDAKITAKDLEVALKAWKINQDEVDAINTAAKDEVKPPVTLSSELTAMIGTDIKID